MRPPPTPAASSRVPVWIALLAVVLLSAGCSFGGSSGSGGGAPAAADSASAATPSASAASARPVTRETLWLCRPGMTDNPCEGGLDATSYSLDGAPEVVPFTPAQDPGVDCFYVYPTVSESPRMNAPLKVTKAEVRTVRAQAARFTQSCRLYAPMYRQITRAGLVRGGLTDPEARARAYGDVLSAFNDYLNNDNNGRPFVLIGHSQGAMTLTQLVSQEIDQNPTLRSRMLSALLIGGNVTTAAGQPTGGSFLNVGVCQTAEQSGCVVAYSTYAGTPPANGLFGRTLGSLRTVCVSPAALLGRGEELTPYLPTSQIMGGQDLVADAPDTGFVTFPGRVSGRCRSTSDFTWMDVTIDRTGLDALPDLGLGRDPAWGLHTVDVSLALGDLVDLVGAQASAWAERGGPSD